MSKIIGAVEIGTSSAKALVGEVGETGAQHCGNGYPPKRGRKGEIMDLEKQPLRCMLLLKRLKKCPEPQLIQFI